MLDALRRLLIPKGSAAQSPDSDRPTAPNLEPSAKATQAQTYNPHSIRSASNAHKKHRTKNTQTPTDRTHTSSADAPQKTAPHREPTAAKSLSPLPQTRPKQPAPWRIEDFSVPAIPEKTRFHDFRLAPELMRAIHAQGFTYCTPIQAQVLGHTLKGQDAIGRAQTGTGKTAAFLISLITQLLNTPAPKERYMGEPRALIIAPTRELVVQIAKDAEALTQYCKLNIMSFVGGMDFDKQLKQLESRFCDILVATPGRLLDFCQRGEVHLDMVEVMVLDEADRMLDMGFIPQVRQIIRQTPHKGERQTLLFSATFTEDVMNLARQWTLDPAIVEIEPEQVASDRITQHIYAVSEYDKYPLLYNLIARQHWERVMVFANRKEEVRRIQECLTRDGISAAQMSGDVPQHKRIRVLENFRAGKIRVLVATDVAGRGIHIEGVSHVINYTLPETPDDYVHRIGRTGRAGAQGASISFAGENDAFALPPIEALLGCKLRCETPPAALLMAPPHPKN